MRLLESQLKLRLLVLTLCQIFSQLFKRDMLRSSKKQNRCWTFQHSYHESICTACPSLASFLLLSP